MTARKPRHEPTDWVKIINAIATGVVMVMMAYFTVTQRNIKESVDHVKMQTDGTLTAAKLAVAISAETTAAVTKTPEDLKTAKEAREAYNAQVANQSRAENQ